MTRAWLCLLGLLVGCGGGPPAAQPTPVTNRATDSELHEEGEIRVIQRGFAGGEIELLKDQPSANLLAADEMKNVCGGTNWKVIAERAVGPKTWRIRYECGPRIAPTMSGP